MVRLIQSPRSKSGRTVKKTSKVLSAEKRKQTQSKGGKQVTSDEKAQIKALKKELAALRYRKSPVYATPYLGLLGKRLTDAYSLPASLSLSLLTPSLTSRAARNQSQDAALTKSSKKRERTSSGTNSGSSKGRCSRAVLFSNEDEEEEEKEEEKEEAEEEEDDEEEDEEEEEEEEEPDALMCPLSLELLSKAVCAADGHTYNEDVLQAWIDRCRNDRKPLTSPLSGKPMQPFFLPNQLIKTQVRDYIEAREKREKAKDGRGREGGSTKKWEKGKVGWSKKEKKQNTKENMKAPAKANAQKQKKRAKT
eukprot:evm.model.NODE_22520_length_6912_cov_44.531975.2